MRSIKPLDRDTIIQSVKKTHKALFLEEGWPQCGVGSEVVTIIQEHAFDDLDAPVVRIAGEHCKGMSCPIKRDADVAPIWGIGCFHSTCMKRRNLPEESMVHGKHNVPHCRC